jgi:hypothetical protein
VPGFPIELWKAGYIDKRINITVRLCSDTGTERPGQTEQHPGDTEQMSWTGSVGSTVRGWADGTERNH